MSKKQIPKPSETPNPPKKPLTAYFRYLADNRESFKKKHPEEPEKRIMSLLGEAWKTVPENAKKKYEEAYQKDKKKYDEEIKDYTQKYGPLKAKSKKNKDEDTEKKSKKIKNEKPKPSKK